MCWRPNAARPTAGTSTFIGLSQLFSSYIKEKKLNILVQFAIDRDPQMPDVATVIELTKDPEAKQIFRQLVSNDEIGRSLFTTPNVPAAAPALCCAPPSRTCSPTRNFAPRPNSSTLPLVPKSGEEMQKVVADMFTISPDTLAKIRELSK